MLCVGMDEAFEELVRWGRRMCLDAAEEAHGVRSKIEEPTLMLPGLVDVITASSAASEETFAQMDDLCARLVALAESSFLTDDSQREEEGGGVERKDKEEREGNVVEGEEGGVGEGEGEGERE